MRQRRLFQVNDGCKIVILCIIKKQNAISKCGPAMRHSTPDFAIEIHAKVLVGRFKRRAKIEAESHAHLLKQKGDEEGHRVWTDVAKRIQSLQSLSDKANLDNISF